MASSVLHIQTEIECRVYLFDEEKGIATPGKWFNLEVRKGESELLFISTTNNNLQCEMTKQIDEADSDYKLELRKDDFRKLRFSIREFAEQYGKPTNAGSQPFKDKQDNPIMVQGISFGTTFVIFCREIVDEHPDMNAYGIAKYILTHTSSYKIVESPGWTRNNGSPVYVLESIDKGREKGEKQVGDPYYLFFDTETSGLPKDDSAPASDTRNWPRLIQLAWILTDEVGIVLSSSSSIIKPDGFTISKDATKVHGIEDYKAAREGKPLKNVIEEFLNAAEKARCLVGHNIAFDQKVVGAELCRLGIKDTISTVKGICTMKNSTDYCELPGGYYGYKPPKLQELYHKLFGCNFDDAHDAMADVKATMKCFFELKRREVGELVFAEGLALLNH